MKRGRYILLILLIFFVLIVATTLAFIYFEFGRPPAVKAQSYLEITLGGEIAEWSAPDFFTSLFLGGQPLSVHDVWENLRKAKVDSRISGVLLRLNMMQCDWAKVDEIRDAVLDFRKSGKKVYAYVEEAPDFDREYYLATACDRIILHPLGWLGINGIGGDVPFFKRTLDKLGIRAEFEHVEEFKTAYNQFTEDGFTEPHRLMIEAIYSDIFDRYVQTVARARGKTDNEMRALIDEAFFQGERALQAGLVDDLLFDDEVEKLFAHGGRRPSKIGHAEYAKIKPSSVGLERGRRVALIYAMGPILSGESLNYQMIGSQTLARQIRRARLDSSVAAVVLRVDSPGGSAVASDTIWREVMLTKKEKPVVVSMSDVAGSGGYWIAMAAHRIIAHPQTLTASIGVLAGKFSFEDFYQKIGITSERLAYGRRAGIFSTFRDMTEEERKLLKTQILWIYDRFLAKVAEGRSMTKDKVDEIGKGRVWTGAQAKPLGLVDELGSLSLAIEEAKKLAGIPSSEDVRLDVWPRRVSFWRSLFGRGGEARSLRLGLVLTKALAAFETMGRESVLALMPLAAETR